MSEKTDAPNAPEQPASSAGAKPAHRPPQQPPKQASSANGPGKGLTDYDEIPVEELVRLTRELTQRITNADRQRLAEELQSTGHQRAIQMNGPLTLQQFFTGEIDLDTELAHRFANAPLMASMSSNPRKITALTRRASAILTAQDGAAMMIFDVELQTGRLEASFTANSMLSFRFDLGFIEKVDRQRWVDLMRRKSGIAFLWTKERWENDYMIWVVREYFTRVYAFSPKRFEAGIRMTPDTVEKMLNWFEAYWLRNQREEATKSSPKKAIDKARLSAALNVDATPPPPPPEPATSEDPPADDDSQPSDPSKFSW